MNFDISDENKAIAEELGKFLARSNADKSARAVLEGEDRFDRILWESFCAHGWMGASLPERYGGNGRDLELVCCMAQRVGALLAAIPFSSTCLAVEAILAHGTESQKDGYLPELCSGKRTAAFAIAEGRGDVLQDRFMASDRDGRFSGNKVGVVNGSFADFLLVATGAGDETRLHVVDVQASGVTRIAESGLDPVSAVASFSFDGVAGEPLAVMGRDAFERLVDHAAVLLAFEQLGLAEAALAVAVGYVKERKAFGRPVGSFQIIKHKLADVWASIEIARANAYYALWALDSRAPEFPLASATARVAACQAVDLATQELIQVHGGIGVTWEHDAHLLYRRGRQLNLMLGSVREWTRMLSDGLIAEHRPGGR